ncbi:hypothetical protein B0I35DRAFT_447895 [Stachybotrys elegans]|uniref:Oxidoreductase-like protein n=1 Tax=Stachybotrys elegans TaxID=80388 RepID=A0A8K0T0C6_9HYPO|nr:hypothetical protein B0I35DRAFT_447895 [Stachybotrys elegans]
MEARSLADLNQLASNPPQYPVNPTRETHEPLVLYISRVPGTRDVILSTFKPGLKNVTAEDVSSSFYYVHHELPSAEPWPAPSRVRDDANGRSSEDSLSSSMVIRRKPLPPDARPMTPESIRSNPLAPPGYSSGRPSHDQTRLTPDSLIIPQPGLEPRTGRPRAATTGTDTSSQSHPFPSHADGQPTTSMPRKPVGPRPMDDEEQPPPLPERNPPLPPRPNSQNHVSYSKPPSPTKRAHPIGTPFTLTLIRRDPSSGMQWNVGKITSHQPDLPEQADWDTIFPAQPMARLHSSPRHPAIEVRIENSGYAKFRNMPRRSMDTRPSGLCAPLPLPSEDMTKPDGGFFARQVVMEYTKSWTTNLKEMLRKHHGRSDSVPVINTNGPTSPTDGDSLNGVKPIGYTFATPWDGRCQFRTGNGGRSLRCHVHQDGSTINFNPLVGGQDNDAPTSSVVSELRFNLPSSELFGSDRDPNAQRRGHFGKFFRQDAPSDESLPDDEPVSPFEMHLGKEKAGGGNRGTRAKLGKLIIYNDGLKMLDLLVSANIGVWWAAWERSF